ncbi:MAG: FtsW/RodA/SpoVE family cell cycle protein [Oscillospiraceae bacterium]|nr:FtsW/RodA/SpoVE family cell cycle protein [Oscillospiraceae bacterium]
MTFFSGGGKPSPQRRPDRPGDPGGRPRGRSRFANASDGADPSRAPAVQRIVSIDFMRRYDYLLLAFLAAILVFGFIVLPSAVDSMRDGQGIIRRQVAATAMGAALFVTLSLFDYRFFRHIDYVLHAAACLALIYVFLFGFGGEGQGSTRWVSILGFSFQPSEVVKITFVLVCAKLLDRLKERFSAKDLFLLIGSSAVPIGLIVIQPDFGMALMLLFTLVCMLYVYGFKYRYFIELALASIPIAIFTWFFLLNDKRKQRILVFMNPGLDVNDGGWHVDSTTRAIGSGGVSGKGLFGGIMTQRGVIPVKESDSIFAVIGEELGFVGCMAIIALIMLLLARCLYVAMRARDRYGSYIVFGLTSVLAFHYVENIGMNVGMLPLTGIPMPFVSAGGSAMISNLMLAGIIMGVSLRREKEAAVEGG